ncbi:hypothetical protein [Clostridioides sp. ZZV14-6345]|uniref:hypothetical protein n=1 Tax=Clostridioides sp. ZZV14-6345 TaxID=2811496 RepID=UPI001D12B42E|nr:hypothetical protein [Clostridioides sp. ZZV14-6345]
MRKIKRYEITRYSSVNSFDEYIKYLEQKGYIDSERHPVKCFYCGCKKIKIDNEEHLDGFMSPVCEYDAICKSCNKKIGHWAYGSWGI